MQYQDFNIRILGKRDDGYDVSVESPAGSVRSHIQLDVDGLAGRIGELSGKFRGAAAREATYQHTPARTPQEIGGELFAALFTDGVRTMYDRSTGQVLGDPNAGLRLKLHFDLDDPQVSALAQLPWELVFDASNQDFLAQSRRTPIVRYIEVQRPLNLPPLHAPLRVLVVMSSPSGHAALDLTKERALIEGNWARDDNVKVDFLEHPTKATLLDALIEKQYHVLHYMGHGAYDPTSGAGALVLEDSHGNAQMLDAQTFGTWLRDAPTLRLIVLNACDTGKASEEAPFSGIANRMVSVGVPAVVAMQFLISDDAAIKFSSKFYQRLVEGFPVDEATAQGRKAIMTGTNGAFEWATPVLYMRAPDGRLFDIADDNAAPAATASASSSENATSGESASNTVVVQSVFLAIVFAGLSGFCAFMLGPDLENIRVMGASLVAITVTAVALYAAMTIAGLREAADPMRSALFALTISVVGIHSALLFGPLAAIKIYPTEHSYSDYPITFFCATVVIVTFALVLAWHVRRASWVYAVGPPLAVVLIIFSFITIGRKAAQILAEPPLLLSVAKHGFLFFLLMATSLSAIVVCSAFLAAKSRYGGSKRARVG